jgi:hypothetical protein
MSGHFCKYGGSPEFCFTAVQVSLFDTDVSLFDTDVSLFDTDVSLFDTDVSLFDTDVSLLEVHQLHCDRTQSVILMYSQSSFERQAESCVTGLTNKVTF